MKAIILAGGYGTCLKEITGDETPKPMVSIAGKPFLEHQILFLKEQGVTDIILAVHHHADKIKSYFGDGRRLEVNITYSEEEVPLGTGGAIKKAERYIDDTFFVLNGDSYSQFSLKELLEFHKSKKSNFTLSLIKSKNPENYGGVILDESRITRFSEKIESAESLINAGTYIFEPKIFDFIKPENNVSLEKDVFPVLASGGLLYGYPHSGYFMDIGTPKMYNQFKKDVVESLFLREHNTIKEAMQKIGKSEIDLILVVDEKKKLLGVLTNRIIKKFILSGGDIETGVGKAMLKDPITGKVDDDNSKISQILLSGTNKLPILDEEGRVSDVRFRAEEIKTQSFPVVRGKTPLRISFAGGGTDLPYFFEKYGGVVINSTIDKYCYATIIKRADKKIIINSDIGEEIIIDSVKEMNYNGRFDIIKSVIHLMKPDFGFELYLYNDIPPGRGLGSSASLAVLIVNLISYLQNISYDDHKIAEIAHKAECEGLGIKGGWQDQYAAVIGGFNFMEFDKDRTIVYPLRLKQEMINELNHHLLLCYVGKSHFSGNVHKSQEEIFLKSEEDIINKLKKLKEIAVSIKDYLLISELERIGELLHKSWMIKKELSKDISDSRIDQIYDIGIRNGAYGGKLLGAGSGGYILFFHQPKKRNQLKKALEEIGGEILNFNFEFGGMQIWPVKNKF